MSGLSWFPTAGGVPIPGVPELLTLLIIMAAMYLRGGSLPGRGQLVEKGLPEVPRPKRLLSIAAAARRSRARWRSSCCPFDFRQALVNSEIGVVMALSLVVITGFVGQISVVQLSLAGRRRGFVISRLATDHGVPFPWAPLAGITAAVVLGLVTAVSALRVRGVSLVIVTLAAAVAISQFYFNNTQIGAGAAARPCPTSRSSG